MRILLASLLILLTFTFTSAQETGTEVVPPGWWRIPTTDLRIKVGGYVKLDFIHDFNPINSPDFFDVTRIPTDGSEGQRTHLNVKETRFFVDVIQPSKVGQLRFYLENDFYGANGALRIRHAFMEIGSHWLVGQSWSNFMDETIIPPTLDFEKPAAYAFLRHPLIRWKTSLSDKSYIAFALEEPSTNAQAPTDPGDFESHYPDFTGRYRYTGAWGHIQVSAFGAVLSYRYSDTKELENVVLGGVNVSGLITVHKRDQFTYQVIYGPGVSRYRGGEVAAPDGDGNLEPLTETGITLSYLHFWSPAVSSLLVYNQGSLDNSAGQPENSISMGNYVSANVLWHITESLFVGAEYHRGMREDINEDSGVANRIQFSARYSFNMH